MVDIPVYANDAVVTVIATSDGQTDFDFDFLAYDGDQIKATFKDVSEDTTQDLTYPGDFTVSGIGVATGGSITLTALGATVVTGDEITIYRDTTIERLTDFQQSGDYFADTVNREEDLEFMIMQELGRDTDRALKVAFGNTGPEVAIGAAGSLLVYDATGNISVTPVPVPGAGLIGNPAGDGWIIGSPTDAIVLASDVTFRVPTDFATLEAALDETQKYSVKNGARVFVELESGYEWPANITLFGLDLRHVTIISVDAIVRTAATFPANDALITFTFCVPPVWQILVDMEGRGDNGVELINSDLHVIHRCGVGNAGANGSPHREAYGSCFVQLGTSQIFCDPVRETVLTTTGHTAAGGTTTTFQLAAADQQPDNYYVGHVIAVTNGVDTSEADIIDYDNATNTVRIRHAQAWTAANDGVGLTYTIELLRGLMAYGGARRGITPTWGSQASVVAGYLRNNGTDARDAGHTPVFHRRGSTAQFDRCDFTGSVAAFKVSRAGKLSARQCYMNDIAGHIVSAAEGTSVSLTACSGMRCGLATGGTPLPLFFMSSAEGRGGDGGIDAAGGEFDFAVSTIARTDSQSGRIDLGDGRFFECEGALCEVDGGDIDVSRVVGTTSATAGIPTVILCSSLSSSVPALSLNWDAQGGADRIVRAINSGHVSLSNAVIANAAVNLLDVDDSGKIFFENTSLDGVIVAPSEGWTWEPNGAGPSRADAVVVIDAGAFPGDGVPLWFEGEGYKGLTGSTAIADMLDFVPLDAASPEHWAAVGDGVTDDNAAIQAMGLYGGEIKLKAGKTYIFDEVQFAAGSTITTNGATLRTDGAVTPTTYANSHILFRENCTLKDEMKVTASGLASGVHLIHCFENCDVEFDLRADTELTSNALVMQGESSNLRNITTRNFARPVVLDGTLNGNEFAQNWDADGTATESVAQLGAITTGIFTKTADFSFKLEFDVPASAPAGCIAEIGASTLGFYVGFTSGNLVVRVGDGASGHPAGTAKVTFPEGQLLGRAITLYGAVDVSENKLTVWAYEGEGTEVFTLSDVSASAFTNWAGTGGGAVGTVSGDGTCTGENATNYNDTINGAFFWDSSLQDGEPNYAEGFQSGGHDLKGITRGFNIRQQKNINIGSGQIYERSAQAIADGETPGYNGFLFDGVEDAILEDQYISEAGEHAIRIAGPRSNNISWGVLTLVRASASSFKINGGTNLRSKSIVVAGMNIVDPCWETGTPAKASHVIRVSHTDGFVCGPVSIMETGDVTLTRGTLAVFSNSSDCVIESVTTNMDWPLVKLTDQEDVNGDTIVGVHDISIDKAQCYEPQSGENIINIDMQDAAGTIGWIRIDLNVLGTRAMSRDIVNEANAVAGYDGPIILTGTMSQFKASDVSDLTGQQLSCDFMTHGAGNASRILITPQAFDGTNAADTASLFLQNLNGTAGAGNVGASMIMSRIGSRRPGAGVVAGQQGSDADQVSLEVWVHSAAGSGDELTLHSRFQHNGPLDLLSGTNPSLRVNGQQVVGAREPALPVDATDLASAIALVNALKAGLNANGHGLFNGT